MPHPSTSKIERYIAIGGLIISLCGNFVQFYALNLNKYELQELRNQNRILDEEIQAKRNAYNARISLINKQIKDLEFEKSQLNYSLNEGGVADRIAKQKRILEIDNKIDEKETLLSNIEYCE